MGGCPSVIVNFRIQIISSLVEYLDLRAKSYKQDKCWVSWLHIQRKCLQFAKTFGFDDFVASPGWISDTLKHHGKIGINLHGEAEQRRNV